MKEPLSYKAPIVIIGAGGIVNDAHLPAYQLAGFDVAGIYDVDKDKAHATAQQFNIPLVFDSMEDIVRLKLSPVVYDIAVPASAMMKVLEYLPAGSAVLMQKPMGNNYAEAKAILQYAREKQLVAAVNFQLRYAPFITAARKLIQQGALGQLCDIEINVNVFTPWHLWTFLYESPRVEILYHSIHYIDLVRWFLGNPAGVYAKTVKHPEMDQLASVRSNIIMDYGDLVRANILTNHCHQFGLEQQQSWIKLEGTQGAVKIEMGLLMNYPHGVADQFKYITRTGNEPGQWKTLAVEGSWFPHAFIGSMEQVMQAAAGNIPKPDNSVEDCIYTMACVEAAYRSSERGGVGLKDIM
ncbi:Gfo/Idh/MocA family oxidoreductase [Niastella caeni]|uniref:Gfo/Idh/MocA family oxidoreductase n=1 Tax=Niastella caeni TaxID=2569763 RepID=A0A4S8H8K3_9BACT|nr:Gfo/Idh/MocA family oxidoreductase [Niastella caeni]THU31188.1 Gfo/Idh/MocA family oxidoreductase [Niastella caeni]